MSYELLSPTQTRIIRVLSDGMPHPREELRQCIDGMATIGNISNHLSAARKILRPMGEDIVCELLRGAICYRHVRLLRASWKE